MKCTLDKKPFFSLIFALAAMLLTSALTSRPAYADGTSFAIFNLQTSNCIDVAHAATTPGAGIIQYHCTGGTNQRWYADVISYEPTAGGAIMVLRNVNSGLCLDLAQQSVSSGVGLVQNTCNGSTSQQWRVGPPYGLTQVGGTIIDTVATWRSIVNVFSGLCLDNATPGGDYTAVQQWSCASQSNQAWRVPLF